MNEAKIKHSVNIGFEIYKKTRVFLLEEINKRDDLDSKSKLLTYLSVSKLLNKQAEEEVAND